MADEYISREAFKAEALRLSTHYLNEWDTLGVLAAADRIPAADVQPVRHGRWNVYSIKDCLYTCSECHCLPRDRTRYCPNCGALMSERGK